MHQSCSLTPVSSRARSLSKLASLLWLPCSPMKSTSLVSRLKWVFTSKLVSRHGLPLLMKMRISTADLDPVPHVDVFAGLTEVPLRHGRISIRTSHTLKWLNSISTKGISTWKPAHSQSLTEVPEFLLKSLDPFRFGIWYLLNSTSSAVPEAV